MNGTLARKATQGQIKTIQDILAEFQEIDADAAQVWKTELNLSWSRGQFDFDFASATIKEVSAAKRNAARAKQADAPRVDRPEVPAGRYAIRDENDVDVVHFYQVDVSDKGFYTVFAQASSELHEITTWATARAVLAQLAADPKAAAILYGQEKGVCGRCGAELTSKWRLQGIGPVCVTKFG